MRYYFEQSEAIRFGFDAAFLISHLRYWLQKNRESGTNYLNGRYWTYFSRKTITKLFPMWTARQVDRIVRNLIKAGVLITDQHPDIAGNTSLWYSFVDVRMIDGPLDVGGDVETPCRKDDMPAEPNGVSAEPICRAPNGTTVVLNGEPVQPNRAAILPIDAACSHQTVSSPHQTVPSLHQTALPLIKNNSTNNSTNKRIENKSKNVCESTHTRERASQGEDDRSAGGADSEYFLHLCPARLRNLPEFCRFWRNYVESYNRLSRRKSLAPMSDLKADGLFYRLNGFQDPIGALNAAIVKETLDLYDQTSGSGAAQAGVPMKSTAYREQSVAAPPTAPDPEQEMLDRVYHPDPVLNSFLVLLLPLNPDKWLTGLLRYRIQENPGAARVVEKMLRNRYPEKAAGMREHYNYLARIGLIEEESIETHVDVVSATYPKVSVQ